MTVSFQDALTAEYRKWKNAGTVPDAFGFYSGLSERIGSDYSARRKAELFFRLDGELLMVDTFMNLSADAALSLLGKRYNLIRDVISEKSYLGLLRLMAHAAAPEHYGAVADTAESSAVSVTKRGEATPQKTKSELSETDFMPKRMKLKDERLPGECGVKAKTVTPQDSGQTIAKVPPKSTSTENTVQQTSPPAKSNSRLPLVISGMVGIATYLMITFLPWTTLQWIVGIVAGIIANGLMIGIAYLLEDSAVTDTVYGPLLFLLPVIMAANIALMVCIGSGYKVIFGCVAALETIAHIVFAILGFDDCEEGGALGHIAEGTVNAIATVILIFAG